MKTIKLYSCHAAGEVGDVVVSGLPIPAGNSVRDIARKLSESRWRSFLMNEPRGGLFRHKNILVPPVHPDADFGFVIFEPEDTPPMSGSNCICTATVLLEAGMHPMQEPETELILEAPAGLVKVIAECERGRVKRVRLMNVPSFVCGMDLHLDVPGLGRLRVDSAYGGDSFIVVDAAQVGLDIVPENGRDIADTGARIIAAANEQIGFEHPEIPWLRHFAFCMMTVPARREQDAIVARHSVTIQPGKLDRSPTGTGCSARMALMHARGQLGVGERFVGESLIGSRFDGRIVATTRVADRDAVLPEISGRGFVMGVQELWVRDDDPFPEGYRVSDTWPNSTSSKNDSANQ